MGSFESTILYWLTLYKIPATFVGSFLFGETVILTAAVLAFRLGWSVTAIFITVALGTIISDLIWYGLGKKVLEFSETRNSNLYKKYREHFGTITKMVQSKRPFTILLYFKFFYGTRIITLLYLSVHRIKFRELLFFDTIGTVIYHAILFTIAFLSTAGVYNAIHVFHEYTLMLTSIAVSLLVIKVFTIWTTKKTEKK